MSAAGRLAVITLSGVLVLLPFALWEVHTGAGPALTLRGLELVALAAVLPGYAAYLAYSVRQREFGAARVSVSIYLGPLWTAALAWLLLAEPLHRYHALVCCWCCRVLSGDESVEGKTLLAHHLW
ncbi:MAG: EamA family transporter [Betaproteobacteria bacterium]